MKEPNRKNWFRSYADSSNRTDKRTGGPAGRSQFSTNAIAPVPKRSHVPITQNYTEKYALQKEIVNYDNLSGNINPAGFDVQSGIYTPSDRLILTIQLFFESQDMVNIDPALNNVPAWSITRLAVNSISGRESPMSKFYPSGAADTPFPDEVIIPDAPELLRVNIHVDNDQFHATYAPNGAKLFLQAKWEPDVQTIPPDELRRLYERCRITYGNPLTIGNVTIP